MSENTSRIFPDGIPKVCIIKNSSGADSTSQFSGCAKRTSLKQFRKAITDELKEWEYCDSKVAIIAFLGCVDNRMNGGLGCFSHNRVIDGK